MFIQILQLGELTIASDHELIEAISLYSLHGQEVWRKEALYKKKVRVQLEGMVPGTYIIQYKTVNGFWVEKIVLK